MISLQILYQILKMQERLLIGQELRDLRVEQSPQVQVERQGNLLDYFL